MRHRSQTTLRPDRCHLRAGGGHGFGSSRPGASAGGPASFGLGSAQPRCGCGSWCCRRWGMRRGQLRALTGETPGALFGLVPRPGSTPGDTDPWRRGGGSGGGLGLAPSGTQAQPAAARRPTPSRLEVCQPAGGNPARSGGCAACAELAQRASRGTRIKPRIQPNSGLHRQPRPQLAGRLRATHQSSRAGAHRSKPAGQGPASNLCQRRLRCDRRLSPGGLRRVGGSGSAGAGCQSRAMAGLQRAARRIGPITPAATLAPPGPGPTASR